MTDVLQAVKRDQRGTKRNRRLRATGYIPAVIYGHGKESISISIAKSEVDAAIRHGNQIVKIAGEVTEDALIKTVQWDAFGSEVIHVDFTRVLAGESVEVTLNVELRGEAPGTKSGGVVEQPLHEIEVRCPVSALPDKLELTINSLELGDSLTVADVPLPDGAELITNGENIVVHCVEAAGEEAEQMTEADSAEPELIGGRGDDNEGNDSE